MTVPNRQPPMPQGVYYCYRKKSDNNIRYTADRGDIRARAALHQKDGLRYCHRGMTVRAADLCASFVRSPDIERTKEDIRLLKSVGIWRVTEQPDPVIISIAVLRSAERQTPQSSHCNQAALSIDLSERTIRAGIPFSFANFIPRSGPSASNAVARASACIQPG